jgi:tRNA threonylcarbamoyladenosine biosynthesis protein TsaB
MLVLAWDTSTPVLSVALTTVENQSGQIEVLAKRSGQEKASHSGLLPPLVQEILKENNLKPKEVDLLAVGCGPGSFTGLRTGLALAKGLSLGLEIPLVGFSSLTVLAASVFFEGSIASVIDARHQEIFLSVYKNVKAENSDVLNSFPEKLSEVLVVKPSLIYERLEEFKHPFSKMLLIGPGISLLPNPRPGFLLGLPTGPDAELLTRLAVLSFNNFESLKYPALPLYGRSPEIFKTWKHPKRVSPENSG